MNKGGLFFLLLSLGLTFSSPLSFTSAFMLRSHLSCSVFHLFCIFFFLSSIRARLTVSIYISFLSFSAFSCLLSSHCFVRFHSCTWIQVWVQVSPPRRFFKGTSVEDAESLPVCRRCLISSGSPQSVSDRLYIPLSENCQAPSRPIPSLSLRLLFFFCVFRFTSMCANIRKLKAETGRGP